MAEVANPHKKFQFSIFLFGMNPFLVQKVTLPDRSVDQIEHGEGNHLVKTGGLLKFSNMMLDKISNASLPENLIWIWISLVQNGTTGGGAIPEIYKKTIQVQKLSTNMAKPIKTWNYVGVWPVKINGVELDRVSSDNTIESIELSVDDEIVI